MPTPVSYTNTDNIRAALGVSAVEMSDQRIIDTQIEMQLGLRLTQVCTTDPETIKTDGTSVGATQDQKNLWYALQLYCMYYGAVLMMPALQMLVAATVTDSETTNTRFGVDDIQATIDRITGRADYYAGLLNPAYETSTLGFTMVGVVSPSYDPVTNWPPKPGFLTIFCADVQLYLGFPLPLIY